MEKKKNKWVGKIIVLVLLAASVGSYYVFPSVKHVMNQVFKMFASGDFTVVRDFVASYGAYAAVISGILDHICKCQSVWMVAGSNPVMEQCNGRCSSVLLYCENPWT